MARAVRRRRGHRHDPAASRWASCGRTSRRRSASVFGLGFAIEGFSFFLEAIFIGIYVYGWDRLSPRAHFASGIPIVVAGFLGSLMVIAVNGWMNHPTGFRLVRRQGRRRPSRRRAVRQPLLLARARPHVHRRLHRHRLPRRRAATRSAAARPVGPLRAHRARDPAHDRRAGRARAGARRRLGRPRGRRATSRPSSRRSRASATTTQRRAGPHPRLVLRARRGRSTGSRSRDLLSLLAFHDPNAKRAGPRRGAGRRPPAGQRRALRVPDDGRDRHAAGAARGWCTWSCRVRRRRLPESRLVLPRARRSPGRCRSSR